MHRFFLVSGLIFATVGAYAGNGLSVRAGYFGGVRFDGFAPTPKVKLDGISVGLDWDVYSLPASLVTIRISPTLVFGGATRKGADQDGTILRILATGKVPIPMSPIFVIGGAGYATSTARGSTKFDTKSSFVTQIGVGTNFKVSQAPVKPFVEISYHGGRKVYTGWSLEVGIRF